MRRLLIFTAVVCMLAPAAPAAAKGHGQAVIRDCTDNGRLDHKNRYDQSDYRDALNHMPSDVQEYTDCYQQIKDAQRQAAGQHGGAGGAGGGGGGGGAPPADVLKSASPGELAAIARAQRSRPKSLALGNSADSLKLGDGPPVAPGAGLSAPVTGHDLPAPLLIPLILIGVAGLALGATALGRVVQSRRSI